MKVVVYYNCPVPVTFLSNTFHLGRVLDEAHTTATCLRAHKMKVLQQLFKNDHRYLYRSLTDTQASVSYLRRISWPAA